MTAPRRPIQTPRNNSPPSRLRLTLLGILFVVSVTAIVFHQKTLLLPLYLSLLAWVKTAFKSLTPKLVVALLKNSIFLKIRGVVIQLSTRFFVLSHRPWRRTLGLWKDRAVDFIKTVYRRYTGSALWLRSAVALALLAVTASSSYMFIAILIIPQSLLNWIRKLITNTLSKLGLTKLLNAIWQFLIPATLRHRWYMYNKWTLGRRQLNASRRMREKAKHLPKTLLPKRRTNTPTSKPDA
jgi:hypothetical protein